MFTQNVSGSLVSDLLKNPPSVFGKSGIVVKIGSDVWLRTGMNRSKWVPYSDIYGNQVSYDGEGSTGANEEWMNAFTGNFVSTDQLLTLATDQKTVDTLENARNSDLGPGKPLSTFDLAWLWFKVKILGMADNTYSLSGLIPWWLWLILAIFVFLFIFKPFKKRR